MNAQGKSIGRRLLVCTCTAVIFVAGLVGLVKIFLPWHCDRSETVLATGPGGEKLLDKFEACTWFATSLDERIDLVSLSGSTETIFEFEPNPGIAGVPGPDGTILEAPGPMVPSASWTTPHSIKVSIGTVAAISRQQSRVQGYEVSYDIGMNLKRYPPRHD
jgi:hypothetical protein